MGNEVVRLYRSRSIYYRVGRFASCAVVIDVYPYLEYTSPLFRYFKARERYSLELAIHRFYFFVFALTL